MGQGPWGGRGTREAPRSSAFCWAGLVPSTLTPTSKPCCLRAAGGHGELLWGAAGMQGWIQPCWVHLQGGPVEHS